MIRAGRRRGIFGEISIEYQDFVVQIGPGREGELAVRVLQSPAGQGGAPFQLPWMPTEWLGLRSGLSRAYRHLGADEAPGETALSPREIGARLFSALFSGQVGDLFSRSRGLAGGRGLRIVLRFQLDEKDPRLTLLHSLPWELLYEPGARDFLGLSRRTPIVRFLEVPRPAPPLPLPSPLRILVAPAAPDGHTLLHLDTERREILDAWEVSPGVDVVVRDLTGPGALRKILLKETFHALHFMGHGEVDPVSGTGVLFFAGPDGARIAVTGEALTTVLKDFEDLRLVFLNSCESGRTPEGSEVDPFAGVATALVLGGLPAVLAMQLPILDDAAILFSRTVYDRLAAGDPIDAAVTEGRQALHSFRPDTVEWAIPVLFTRSADGRIFDPSAETVQLPQKTEPTAPPPPPVHRHRFARAAALIAALALILLSLWKLEGMVSLGTGSGATDFDKVKVGDFFIARHEASNEQYLRFIKAHPEWSRDRADPAKRDPDYLKHWLSPTEYPQELGDHPVTHVSWYAAEAFCKWSGGSLPTQEQWQAAAHTAEAPYPWGIPDPHGPPPVNHCDKSCKKAHRGMINLPVYPDGFPQTSPVNAFPGGATREGVLNLSGNVWEWTLTVSGDKGVTLGGSYLATFEECTTDIESWELKTNGTPDGGFRCIWDEDE